MSKTILNGFDLENYERAKIDKIISKYEKKLSNIVEYTEIFLRLRKSFRGKIFLHEVESKIITKIGIFNSKKTGYNLFAVVAEVLKKTLNEITHKNKKKKNEKEKEKN